MAVSSMEELFRLVECPICTNEYDESEFLPKLTPSCHHTLCVGCLTTILSAGHPCPICRAPIKKVKGLKVSDLKTNPDVFDKLVLLSHMKENMTSKHGGRSQLKSQIIKEDPQLTSLATSIEERKSFIEKEEHKNSLSRDQLAKLNKEARDHVNSLFSQYSSELHRLQSTALAVLSTEYKEEESQVNDLADQLACQRLRLASLHRQVSHMVRTNSQTNGSIDDEDYDGANGTDSGKDRVVKQCMAELPNCDSLMAKSFSEFKFKAAVYAEAFGPKLSAVFQEFQKVESGKQSILLTPDSAGLLPGSSGSVVNKRLLGPLGRRRSLSHSDIVDARAVMNTGDVCEPQFPNLSPGPSAPPEDSNQQEIQGATAAPQQIQGQNKTPAQVYGKIKYSYKPGSPVSAARHGSLSSLSGKEGGAGERRQSSLYARGPQRKQEQKMHQPSQCFRQVLKNVLLINGPTLKFGVSGTIPGKFNKPYAVDTFTNGDILVADCNNFRLQQFSASGEFKAAFPHGYRATDVGILSDRLFVFPTSRYMGGRSDSSESLILMSSDGVVRDEIRVPGAKSCCHLAILPQEQVVCLDYKVHKLFVLQLGDGDKLHYKYSIPLPVKANPYSYVTKGIDSDVLVTTRDGVIIIDIQRGNTSCRKIGSKGEGMGEFRMPSGVVVEPNCRTVFVADYFKGVLMLFTYEGEYIGNITSQADNLHLPNGLTMTKDGNSILVADMNNHCIKGFPFNL